MARVRKLLLMAMLVLGLICIYAREADEGDEYSRLDKCEELVSHEQPACRKRYGPPWQG